MEQKKLALEITPQLLGVSALALVLTLCLLVWVYRWLSWKWESYLDARTAMGQVAVAGAVVEGGEEEEVLSPLPSSAVPTSTAAKRRFTPRK